MNKYIHSIARNYRRLQHVQNDADSVWKDDVKKQFFEEFDLMQLESQVLNFKQELEQIVNQVKDIEHQANH